MTYDWRIKFKYCLVHLVWDNFHTVDIFKIVSIQYLNRESCESNEKSGQNEIE
jgi:hypothetical protein